MRLGAPLGLLSNAVHRCRLHFRPESVPTSSTIGKVRSGSRFGFQPNKSGSLCNLRQIGVVEIGCDAQDRPPSSSTHI